jgi:hypothetical protein
LRITKPSNINAKNSLKLKPLTFNLQLLPREICFAKFINLGRQKK